MSSRNQGPFFPIPDGEVYAYTPDGTTRTEGSRVLSNTVDGAYVRGGPNGCGDGGAFGYASWDGGAGDTTGATPRRPPDYGLNIVIKG